VSFLSYWWPPKTGVTAVFTFSDVPSEDLKFILGFPTELYLLDDKGSILADG
jgi:hypothetical protein